MAPKRMNQGANNSKASSKVMHRQISNGRIGGFSRKGEFKII